MTTIPIRCAAAFFMALMPAAMAQTPLAPRDVPARSLPVPGDVSPEAQNLIAQPLRQNWDKPPTTPEGWRTLANTGAATLIPVVPGMLDRLHVKVEATTMDGVKVFVLTPAILNGH